MGENTILSSPPPGVLVEPPLLLPLLPLLPPAAVSSSSSPSLDDPHAFRARSSEQRSRIVADVNVLSLDTITEHLQMRGTVSPRSRRAQRARVYSVNVGSTCFPNCPGMAVSATAA